MKKKSNFWYKLVKLLIKYQITNYYKKKSLIVTKFFVAINLYCNKKKFVARCYDKVCGDRILQQKYCCNKVMLQLIIFIIIKNALLQQKILLQQNFWQNSQSCLFRATNNLCKFFQAPFRRCVIFWQNNDSKSRFFHHFKEFCQNRFFFSNSSSSLKVRMPLFFKYLYIWSVKFLRVSMPLN